jgi:formate hydrogenlyase subunit 6/NADH:ubiquinone oxidoreductase subunit I
VWEGDYPKVRDWECIGCAICAQLCPVDAIIPVEAAVPVEES